MASDLVVAKVRPRAPRVHKRSREMPLVQPRLVRVRVQLARLWLA